MLNDCLILAGGSGTRLWPASNSTLPKQFLPSYDNKSFFLLALERASDVGERTVIITGKKHIPNVLKDATRLSATKRKKIVIICEPTAKNTAPAVAMGVVYSLFSGTNRNILVLTSDHIIKPLKVFMEDTSLAAASAADNKLVVFGIPPTRPETGYGYIETGKSENHALNVTAFHEKPDETTAKRYIKNKKFFWNSGMFAFSASFMADIFLSLAPDVFLPFKKLKEPKPADFTTLKGVKVLMNWNGLDTAYKKTKNISFDYAIAEKCNDTKMIAAKFDWIDIGNWEEYINLCSDNNTLVFNIDSNNCFIDSDIPVALAGVNDLIVVIRSGKDGKRASALITRKGNSHKVRDIVEQIKRSKREDLL